MTPEEKSLLERTYKLVEENNDILKSIRRSNRISAVMRILYWVVIIGLSVGAYYVIQPYVDFMLKTIGSLGSLTGNIESANAAVQSLQGLLK